MLLGIQAVASVVMNPKVFCVSYGIRLFMVTWSSFIDKPYARPLGKYMKICAEEFGLETTNA